MRMKIVCLSDTHTLQNDVELPEGNFDVLVHAGDMGNLGKYREYAKIGKWFNGLSDKFKHRIIVPGNHDWGFMREPERIMADHFDEGVTLLIDKGIEIDGVKFYGCPWMLEFCGWAFMREEHELSKYYDAIPDDTEILITHAPPLSILDANSNDYRCGSTTLYSRIKHLPKLKHHIFGHMHGSYGQETIEGVTFHNVASLNERYDYQNAPQIIEI